MSETAEPFVMPVIKLPSGIHVNAATQVHVDWASIKVLVESGVSVADAARHFKIEQAAVSVRASREKWLTPTRVQSLRKEMVRKQGENLARAGKAADVSEVKAQIWEERGEALREKSYNIVKAALEGVTEERAKRFINNPKGLLEIVTATRLITGEEKADAQEGQKVAISIGFLRKSTPQDAVYDVEEVKPGHLSE